MDSCIAEGILKDVLIRQKTEVMHMLLTEFDEKKYKRSVYQDGYNCHRPGAVRGGQRCYGRVYRPHERRHGAQGAACFPKVGRRAQGGVHRKIRADRTGMGCIFPDDFFGQQRPGDRRLPVPVQADGGTAYLRPVRKDGRKIPHHYVPALP